MPQKYATRQIEAQPVLGIRIQTTMDTLASVMGSLFGEIYGYIRESGEAPAGMPLAIYHAMDGNNVDLACALPISSPMEGTDRIRPGTLPAGTVATVTHMGPYDTLHGTWTALMEWIGAQGLEVAHAPWEVYVTDPEAESNPAQWRTDLFVPVHVES